MKREIFFQTGFTLAELMVGMTIGLIVLSGVSSAYIASSQAGRDSQASSEQVENGRQALEFIMYDLRHAGYFGQVTTLPVAGGALPDPCESFASRPRFVPRAGSEGEDEVDLRELLADRLPSRRRRG